MQRPPPTLTRMPTTPGYCWAAMARSKLRHFSRFECVKYLKRYTFIDIIMFNLKNITLVMNQEASCG